MELTTNETPVCLLDVLGQPEFVLQFDLSPAIAKLGVVRERFQLADLAQVRFPFGADRFVDQIAQFRIAMS